MAPTTAEGNHGQGILGRLLPLNLQPCRARSVFEACRSVSGGRFLAIGGTVKTYEGGIDPRTVLIEFDSVEQAVAAHDSPGYQAARLGWVWSGLAGSGRGEGAASAAAFRFPQSEPYSGCVEFSPAPTTIYQCGDAAKPVTLYSDKHSIFRIVKVGAVQGDGMTQFGRALPHWRLFAIYRASGHYTEVADRRFGAGRPVTCSRSVRRTLPPATRIVRSAAKPPSTLAFGRRCAARGLTATSPQRCWACGADDDCHGQSGQISDISIGEKS
jgi:hypothetical protein